MTGATDPVIRFADRLDALRVIPRILVMTYYLFFIYFTLYLADWFMTFDWSAVENQAVALAVAGFPVGILGVMTGVLGTLTNNYFKSGRRSGNGGTE